MLALQRRFSPQFSRISRSSIIAILPQSSLPTRRHLNTITTAKVEALEDMFRTEESQVEACLEDFPALARVLETNPTLAKGYRDLIITRWKRVSPLDEDYADIQPGELATLSNGLTSALEKCRTYLRKFSWSWPEEGTWDESIVVPSHVWKALGAAENLEELEVMICVNEADTWVNDEIVYLADAVKLISSLLVQIALTESANMPNLRVLRVDLSSAHGWDCGHFQTFLDRLPLLEQLALKFPACCGPSELTLATTYPNLKSFDLRSYIISPSGPQDPVSLDFLHTSLLGTPQHRMRLYHAYI